MTRTNAKRGMVQFKNGYGKDSFDYGYLHQVHYNENQTMYDVVAGLRANEKRANERIDDLTQSLNKACDENQILKNEIQNLSKRIDDVMNKYHEALKGVLKR